MINVTQKSENEFIIEWDESDPQESIFNSFTEQDFIDLLKYQAERDLKRLKDSSSTEKEYGETYYNSESEGKDFKDFDERYEEHIHATYEDYKQSIFYAPEEYGTWDIYHKNNDEAP
jgi:hypothetical protein|tara:strand:+ start:138 stop:488 length:351 start_codon:yes stop_codon:yes gene_type:complete